MIEVGKTYRHPGDGREIRVLRDDPDVYELEIALPPGLAHARPHLHADFDQTFTVVEGRAEATVGKEKHDLGPREEVDVPRGTAHVDIWNPGTATATVHNRISPNTPFLEAYAETTISYLCDGRLSAGGDLPVLQVAVIAAAAGGQSYAAGVPVGLQRALQPLLAALGRRRGYRVEVLS